MAGKKIKISPEERCQLGESNDPVVNGCKLLLTCKCGDKRMMNMTKSWRNTNLSLREQQLWEAPLAFNKGRICTHQ